jgi:predicted Zn finger-like uncharacterized protein
VKFLCDNCKAKYQIADEKVAGKTVRMKCRKCGHQIEVRAAVTETSVSTAPPKPDAPPAPPRAAVKSSLATSLSAAKPRQQSSGGALAGAFQRTVQDPTAPAPFAQPAANDRVELSVTDEWYVAINGVPVGPVRISELRRKAAAGAVTEDSLCWQEGLEEWRPIRSVPELAALVREAAQGNRPSLVGPPPEPARHSSPPRPPQRPAPARVSEPPVAPIAAPSARPAAPPRSNVVPLRPAAQLDDASPFAAPLASGTAALAPQLAPNPFAPAPSPRLTPAPAAVAVSDPFAVPPAAAPAAGPLSPPATTSLLPTAPSYAEATKRSVPLWFWPILVLFLGFGIGGGVYLFKGQQPQQIVVQVPVAATTTAAAPANNDVPPPPSAEPPPTPTATTPQKVATGPRPAPAPTSTERKTADISGLLGGTGGPNAGPGGGPSGAGGGGLDSAAVQRVVRDRQAGVKRTCWERGGGEQKSSANVNVAVTVAPNGQVSGATATGDDPVIAKCIENQVRGWSFPAPGSTTTVNIPFHFVRQ